MSCKIQSAKGMYAREYLITVKFVHCTLNKLGADLCAACHTSTLCGDWKGFVVFLLIKISLFFSLLGDLWQELFHNVCNSFVIWQTKGENWDQTDLKMVFRGQSMDFIKHGIGLSYRISVRLVCIFHTIFVIKHLLID